MSDGASSHDALDPGRWSRVSELFEQALELSPGDREDFLRSAAGADAELFETVHRMLSFDSRDSSLLDQGVDVVAGVAVGSPPDLGAGDRVGDYEILGVLGRGGMGVVYRARDRRLGRVAALKFLPLRGGVEASTRRLVAEARAASALDHPNIATIYQVGETADGRVFLAMACYDGETLRQRLRRRGTLPVSEATRVATEVARGLAAAHEAGIIHRDVKPENIFLTEQGGVKLLDFGIAAVRGEGSGGHPGAAVGTARYMSPEQARGEAVEASTDVWSLGAVLCEMLCGEPELGAISAGGALSHRKPVARRARSALAGTLPRVPRPLLQVATRALSDAPTDRYADGGAMLKALDSQERPTLRRRARVGLGAIAAAGVIAIVAQAARAPAPDATPVLAVGLVEVREPPSAPGVAAVTGAEMSGLLTANLSRVPGLPLISTERLEELRAQLVAASPEPPDVEEVVTLAGADQVLEGTLGFDGDELSLRLRLRDRVTGALRELAPVRATHPEELARRATLALAVTLGLPAPTARGVASPSVVASRLYEEGLRAYYEGDHGAATRFFEAALEEDSTLAMAAFYRWRSRGQAGLPRSDSALLIALELARNAPERERLLISAHWSVIMQDPRAVALAESLTVRFPEEPDGHYLLGAMLQHGGDARAAIPHFLRAAEMDSLSLRGSTMLCRACDALSQVTAAYLQIDSASAAERAVRRWLAARPESPVAWSSLAYTLERMGREEEALEAWRRHASRQPEGSMAAVYPARSVLRQGRWEEADRLLRERVSYGSAIAQNEARWFLSISLREQGRFREALDIEIERLEAQPSSRETRPDEPISHLAGQILIEMGRTAEAVGMFDRLVERGARDRIPGRAARSQSWALAHKATALAESGDTAGLAGVVETLREVGTLSAYGRDQRLHHYARGLLFRLQGRLEEAEAELRRAITSMSTGFSRINLELGTVLVALGRPEEAIPVLEAPIPGVLESVHLYASRTELREALGEAYETAGWVDRASEEYRWVLAAWRLADPEIRGRRDRVETRLAALAAH